MLRFWVIIYTRFNYSRTSQNDWGPKHTLYIWLKFVWSISLCMKWKLTEQSNTNSCELLPWVSVHIFIVSSIMKLHFSGCRNGTNRKANDKFYYHTKRSFICGWFQLLTECLLSVKGVNHWIIFVVLGSLAHVFFFGYIAVTFFIP